MRIFVAGATGAVGKRLLPLLVENGHEVVGMTRSRPELVERVGGTPVVADALDRDAVVRAVVEARPEVVVHELTALDGAVRNPRKMAKGFAPTNRLRTEGTSNLIAGARAAGARKFVAQSYGAWPGPRDGSPIKTEDDPFDPNPPAGFRPILDAVRQHEATVMGADDLEPVVLRYGGFYGPGTSISSNGGEQSEMVKKRLMPIVGDGGGIVSLVHIDDVATATVAAIEGHATGIYNIVDDEPAPVREWLPVLAHELGAKPPRRMPKWVARMVGGEAMVVMMTELPGASNAKAKRELGWQLRYPTWREGFANGL
jgi:nucleoside-diphosphate-sugar epimerase